MLFRSFLFATLAGFTISVTAAANPVEQIETCRLDRELTLKTDTQISCDGDLVITEQAHITLQAGRELQIFVHGTIRYPQAGFQIKAEEDSNVLVSALSASGLLKVTGGDISLEYASFENYDQELRPGQNARAEMVLNGQTVALIGPMLKPSP